MDQHDIPEIEPAADDEPLVSLFRHNLWANLTLLDACAALDEAGLATAAVGTYGTIYDTLRHIVGAEQGYLVHLTGRRPERRITREDRPDVATLRELARQTGVALIAVAAAATPDDVATLHWDDKRWPYPFGLILNQVINHATEHRAQVMTILTQLGIEPPDLSGWTYAEPRIAPLPEE